MQNNLIDIKTLAKLLSVSYSFMRDMNREQGVRNWQLYPHYFLPGKPETLRYARFDYDEVVESMTQGGNDAVSKQQGSVVRSVPVSGGGVQKRKPKVDTTRRTSMGGQQKRRINKGSGAGQRYRVESLFT